MKKILLGTSCVIAGTLMAMGAASAKAVDEVDPKELLNLSLAQLSNMEITSVSKTAEKASEAAAAIFVITQDDIKQSGMTSIPELLRMVPGLSVAQSGAHEWAISSRGSTGQFANKLLVLIDGRSVYTPLFSGVWWDMQDTPLQDIERIEVIRGPGATLWGSNAVNGVINIITKNAKDTQGGLASVSAGTVDNALTTVRYGAKAGDNTYARVYAKYDNVASFPNLHDQDRHDAYDKGQSGFRMDGSDGGNIKYTLQGDIYRSVQSDPTNVPVLSAALTNYINHSDVAQGANMLGRVSFTDSDDGLWTLQTYYDYAMRDMFILQHEINTIDVDLQRTWKYGDRQEFVAGTGYRMVADNNTTPTIYFHLNPGSRTYSLFNAFVQDKIALVRNELFLTLGSKLEHNDDTGFQPQPSAKLTWLIDSAQTWWSSISRADRTPNRFADNGTLVAQTVHLGGPNYAFLEQVGVPGTRAEKLDAYETGYRVELMKNLSVDIATFYNRYSNVIVNRQGAQTTYTFPGFGTYNIIPVTPVNGNTAHSNGIELSSDWKVTDKWKLAASYTYIDFKREFKEALPINNAQPPQQANIRSTLMLPHNLEMDNSIYYVDQLHYQHIPSYIRVDARLAWKAMDNLELSLVGQNLFDNAHPEFTGFIYESAGQVPRTVYANITWKF